ncbi:MAG TPA: cytidine deaminase [Candidatus Limnocylindria bacterium]|nr:cytidine deaminase [Candidatus Limnocylindria bacterium]
MSRSAATEQDAIRESVERGSVIRAEVAAALVTTLRLGSVEDLALTTLPLAAELAQVPISGFRVAAVGIEAGSGDLVLGANLEFPGTELWTTVHAEGFVALRARRRGRSLATLAVRAARPCAHCRQTLAESSGADGLAIIDLEGHRRFLEELYPLAFRPAALGEAGDNPGSRSWTDLSLEPSADAPAEVAAALIEAGGRAHAPYSKAPSAAVLVARDGRLATAGCVESVAFNPSITAIQAALVEVAAEGIGSSEVAHAWLARSADGQVDPEPTFRALVAAALPNARLHVVSWRAA